VAKYRLIHKKHFVKCVWFPFYTGELDVVSAFKIFFIYLIVDEHNRCGQQEISKSVCPFTFHLVVRRNWENVHALGFGPLHVEAHYTNVYI
jgi:hypothetical protein